MKPDLEERLLESERHLAVAQDLSLTGSFSWHVSSGEIIWSEQTFRIFGYPPTVKPTVDLARTRIHPEDIALFEEKAKYIPQDGRDFAYEHRLLMPDGTVKHVRVLGHPVKCKSGEIEFVGAVMDVTQQKKTGEALRRSADLFRLVIDTIPGLVWSALPNGDIDFLNQRWLEYTGLSLAEAVGWGWQAAIHPEDLPGLVDYWKAVLASGKPDETEARLRRFDGVYRWFMFRAVPLHDDQGKLVKWYGQTTDIEDRKQAEMKLRTSEAYLAEAQKLSLTGSFGWNVSSGELVWSEETFCILGVDRATKPTLELVLQRVHPEDRILVQQILDRATWDKKHLDFEHRLLMADDSVKHLHVVARIGPGAEKFVGAVMDITEQKRLENRLRQSEKNLAEGQRLTKTGSWILDYKTGNTDWSVETCRIFGFPDPPPSPHYSEFRARVRPEDREGVDRGLRESFETGEPRPLEYVFILPDGVKKNIETISQPVRNEAGTVTRLMGTVMDVTERKAAAEALRASEHLARGQLDALKKTLDALSHESDPDKLPKHVVNTILQQLGAHSATIWERNGDMLSLLGINEDGRFKTQGETGYFGGSIPALGHAPPLWVEALWTGPYLVIEDVNTEPSRIILADGRTAVWHKNDLTGPFVDLKAHLLTQGVRGLLICPLLLAGQLTGIIGIRFTGSRVFGCEEIELTKALAHQAMLAMQLVRLSRQSRDAAVIAERNRMARDIHDTLAQGFTGVIMQLEAAKGATRQDNFAEITYRIERAGELARWSLGEARRSVRALRPRCLQDGNLFVALDGLLKRLVDGTSLNADFQAEGNGRSIPAEYEEDLLRIAQEALTNVVKHAKARNFKITLNVGSEKIQLRLVDDGCGFDPNAEQDGFGLIGMKERVDRMGGTFIIRTTPDVGTEILVELKCTSGSKPENENE